MKSNIDVDYSSREKLFQRRVEACISANRSTSWVVDTSTQEFMIRLWGHHGTYPAQTFGFFGKYCISSVDVRRDISRLGEKTKLKWTVERIKPVKGAASVAVFDPFYRQRINEALGKYRGYFSESDCLESIDVVPFYIGDRFKEFISKLDILDRIENMAREWDEYSVENSVRNRMFDSMLSCYNLSKAEFYNRYNSSFVQMTEKAIDVIEAYKNSVENA